MKDEDIDQRHAAAYHVAGQAVMAFYLGGRVNDEGVEIDERRYCGPREGRCPVVRHHGARAGQGDDDVVSLHCNAQADLGSHATQLGLLGLRRRLLLRRCWRWRLRSRLLTTSAHDSPTNNGEDNDDGGCNSNHLISRHVLTSHGRCPA
jgi:hypothetical protein